MKIRIKGNSIRLRLSQTEVRDLAADRSISECTQISIYDQLITELRPWDLETTSVTYSKGHLLICQPESVISEWAYGDDVSMQCIVDNGTEGGLSVLIEKDFACLNPREGEADLYPNPETGKKC